MLILRIGLITECCIAIGVIAFLWSLFRGRFRSASSPSSRLRRGEYNYEYNSHDFQLRHHVSRRGSREVEGKELDDKALANYRLHSSLARLGHEEDDADAASPPHRPRHN